jgi:hypothetical protein
MKNLFRSLALLPLLGLVAAASTLSVVSSETKVAGLYDYSYSFSVSGAGHGFDNIFLGSNDLSPLNLVIQLNGTATVDWSYLGNSSSPNRPPPWSPERLCMSPSPAPSRRRPPNLPSP